MTLNRWNHHKHIYEPFEVPDDRRCRIYCIDMEELVDCASCGASLKHGEAYTSREIHTRHGFGYDVCEKCYGMEWERERNG